MIMTVGQLLLNGNMKNKNKPLKPVESEYLKRYKRLNPMYDCPKCGQPKVVEHFFPDYDNREYAIYHYFCNSCGLLLKRITYLYPKSDEWFEITFDKDGTPIKKELL